MSKGRIVKKENLLEYKVLVEENMIVPILESFKVLARTPEEARQNLRDLLSVDGLECTIESVGDYSPTGIAVIKEVKGTGKCRKIKQKK